MMDDRWELCGDVSSIIKMYIEKNKKQQKTENPQKNFFRSVGEYRCNTGVIRLDVA